MFRKKEKKQRNIVSAHLNLLSSSEVDQTDEYKLINQSVWDFKFWETKSHWPDRGAIPPTLDF